MRPFSTLSCQRWVWSHLMVMCCSDFRRFRISLISTDVKDRYPGFGTRDPEPQAASNSILPSEALLFLSVAWQQSRMTNTSPHARQSTGCSQNQSRVGPPFCFLDTRCQLGRASKKAKDLTLSTRCIRVDLSYRRRRHDPHSIESSDSAARGSSFR